MPCPEWFDPAWYVYRYPDSATYRGGPFAHFVHRGAEERRDPSPHICLSKLFVRHSELDLSSSTNIIEAIESHVLVDLDRYMLEDVASLQYLLQKYSVFDSKWYLSRNRDVESSGADPLEHFALHGAVENRDPGPAFDSNFYRAEHPEYVEETYTAIEHFVRIGLRRGYAGVGASAFSRWLAAFDILQERDVAHIRGDPSFANSRAVAVHIVDVEAIVVFNEIVEGWTTQIGIRCEIFFLRGSGLSDSAWAACAKQIAGKSGFWAVDSVDTIQFSSSVVVLLCAGAVIPRQHAAYVFAMTLAAEDADMAYSDHDHINVEGERTQPMFKPSMSPTFMRQYSYAGAVVAMSAPACKRPELLPMIAEAAVRVPEQTWATLLLGVPHGKVVHAPFILFHRFAQELGEDKPLVDSVRLSHVQNMDSRDLPQVTIIIPTRDRSDLLRECYESIRGRTAYPFERMRIIVVDNDSKEEETIVYLASLAKMLDVEVIASPGPFNFAELCNTGASHGAGVLVFLNNDTTVLRPDWLRQLVSHAVEPDVGVVGSHLLYPDGSTQHGGVVLGVQGVGAHRLEQGHVGPVGRIDVTREMVAVTGACVAIEREVFDALGGFDPVLAVAFNDVMLCVRAHLAGLRNIYIGDALLYHHESKSRGVDVTVEQRRRNTREAIYTRERSGHLFQIDPTYSVNLSLQKVDQLATPPRVIPPWRRRLPRNRPRVLLLCYQHTFGQGVAIVVEQQALFLKNRGWEVIVGGPKRARDLSYVGCQRVALWTAEDAASFAVTEGVDCIVAHTPPFFSITRFIGTEAAVYFTDHGEPPPRMFPDWQAREAIEWEKRFCVSQARGVFTISQAIQKEQFDKETILTRNGNTHLASWSAEWCKQRSGLRERLRFGESFVVLKVCRFTPGERIYKGVDRYAEVALELAYLYPSLRGKVRFIIAGRGDAIDVAAVEARGLEARADVTDAELIELYAAADLYMSFSEWEGYNLGIGQALAMGLDVVASDIPAHREFNIETSNSVPEVCSILSRRYAAWSGSGGRVGSMREAKLEPWNIPLTIFAERLERDVAVDGRS